MQRSILMKQTMHFLKRYHIKSLCQTLVLAFVFTACQKDLDYLEPDPNQPNGPDTTWRQVLDSSLPVARLSRDLMMPPRRDSFSISFGTTATINAGSGLALQVPGGVLVQGSGLPVSGPVLLESHLLTKRGDLIRMNTPTVSNQRLLVSGGAYYLRFSQQGQSLQLNQQATITVRFNDPAPNPAMQVFFGQRNGLNFNWLPNTDSSSNFVQAIAPYYQVTSNELNWINCDYFYDSLSAPATRMAVQLPSSYTNANTLVYLAFQDIRAVLPLRGNPATRRFESGSIPAGLRATLVILSRQADQDFLGQQIITTATSQVPGGFQEINTTGYLSSMAAIEQFLNSL